MSVNKNYCTAFGIHPIPANTPKADFEAQCEALVESFLALPVAQENFLKFDIIFQNDQLNTHLNTLGLPQPQPVVCLRFEYETEANLAACLQDPDFITAMDAGRSWGFFDNACIFSADVVNKLDSGVPVDQNVAIGIFKVPANMSSTAFSQTMGGIVDAVFTATKPAVTTNMYVQNLNADKDLQAAGFPPVQPVLVMVTDMQSMNEVLKVLDNTAVNNIIAAGKKNFALLGVSIDLSAYSVFSVDVKVMFTQPAA